jgi:hypothetical protein
VDRRRVLNVLLERHAAPEARADLERIAAGFELKRALVLFTAIDRRAGKTALSISGEERKILGATALATAGELARVMVLLAIEDQTASDFPSALRRAYEDGDNKERIAVLRALPFFARPKEALETAIESTRTHVVPIFEALACDNPYPADHFPELNFNQMALKTAFVELPIARIVGLGKRRTPELARMAKDYAAERRAAGRSVPSDLHLLEIPS